MPTHGNSLGNSKALLSGDRRRLANAPATGSVADSFWQGSVVSVGACIRGRHRRRAGSYRSRHRRFTRTPCHRSTARWRSPIRSGHPYARGCGVGRRITGVRLREATWRERALDAEDACLRGPTPRTSPNAARIGVLLGRIRDLEAEWTQDAVQRDRHRQRHPQTARNSLGGRHHALCTGLP